MKKLLVISKRDGVSLGEPKARLTARQNFFSDLTAPRSKCQ